MNKELQIKTAVEKFEALIRKQQERAERIRAEKEYTDYKNLDKLIIGVCGGDGIGPVITNEAARVLEFLLKDEVEAGKVEFRTINGLTIENRAAAGKAIPDDVLAELKKCHVILKGPTTTPARAMSGRILKALMLPCVKSWICFAICARCACRSRALIGPSSARIPRAATQLALRASILPTI